MQLKQPPFVSGTFFDEFYLIMILVGWALAHRPIMVGHSPTLHICPCGSGYVALTAFPHAG